MALGEGDQGISADEHRPELLLAVVGVRVAEVVEARELLPDVPLKVAEPLAVDLVVEHRMAGRPLLHELGENARLVGGLPVVGHLAKDQVPH